MITLIFQVHDKGQHPKGTINCAGYKVLTSLEDYLDLLADSLPGELPERDCRCPRWNAELAHHVVAK